VLGVSAVNLGAKKLTAETLRSQRRRRVSFSDRLLKRGANGDDDYGAAGSLDNTTVGLPFNDRS